MWQVIAVSELGEQLKRTRLEKNISLDEIQAMTKIQKRYLQAIENGEYDKLPGSFYTKAFIKSYAEAVDLDYDSLMENYEHELPKPSHPVESLPPRRTRASLMSPTRRKFAAALPSLIVFLIVIGILALIWLLSINSNNETALDEPGDEDNVQVEQNENAIAEQDNKADPIAEEKQDEPADEPKEEGNGQLEEISKRGDTTTYVLTDTDKFDVEFAFSGESWLKIQGKSGEVYVNEGYSDGQNAVFDFRDEESVRIRIGSTPNIQMAVNGMEVDLEPQPVAQTVIVEFER